MRKLRGDVAALLDASGIDPKALDDPDGAIPFARMGALWMHAAKSFADEFIGIHIAESLPLDSLDIHTYAIRASPTLREALRIAVKFQRLIHETTVLEFDETEMVGGNRKELARSHELFGRITRPYGPSAAGDWGGQWKKRAFRRAK